MKLASLEVIGWLERGPAHQLFRTDDDRLLYRVQPTASPEVRRRARELAVQVADALAVPGAAVPSGAQLHEGTGDEVLISLDRASGRSLLNLKQPLPAELALGLAARILDGLRPVHAAGVFHAALTPRRILLTADGQPLILGLGAAYFTEAAPEHRLAPSLPGFAELYPVAGLIPPEVFNWKPLTPASDVFLIAALAYHWITGGYAHHGDRVMEIYAALRDGRREAFPKLPAEVSSGAVRALEEAFHPQPERRPSTDEVLAALKPFLDVDLRPLLEQAGDELDYADTFDRLAPEDAPGPPGSIAEERRQEVLKRATLQLEVMRTQRDLGVDMSPRSLASARARGRRWSWVIAVALLGAIGAFTPMVLKQTDPHHGAEATDVGSAGESQRAGTAPPTPAGTPQLGEARPQSRGAEAQGASVDEGAPTLGSLKVMVRGPRTTFELKRRQPETEERRPRHRDREPPLSSKNTRAP